MKNEILEIGKVVNTHGIRGELKIQPWCDDPMIFDELEYIYIGGKKYNITKSRFHKTCEIVAVEGIDNINDAEMLKNKTCDGRERNARRAARGNILHCGYYRS